jgi:hypothetical protein
MRLIRSIAAGVLLTGCYTLQPVGSVAPSPGEVVALDINDQGRVALGGSVGPEIARIEGTLVGHDSEEYLLSVRRLQLLRGGEQIWTGERVRIRHDFVGNVYERELSRGRSLTLAAVVVGGFVAFFATRDLLGFGREPPGPVVPPVEELIWRSR